MECRATYQFSKWYIERFVPFVISMLGLTQWSAPTVAAYPTSLLLKKHPQGPIFTTIVCNSASGPVLPKPTKKKETTNTSSKTRLIIELHQFKESNKIWHVIEASLTQSIQFKNKCIQCGGKTGQTKKETAGKLRCFTAKSLNILARAPSTCSVTSFAPHRPVDCTYPILFGYTSAEDSIYASTHVT